MRILRFAISGLGTLSKRLSTSTVAFDTLRAIHPGYFFRCGVMLMTSFLFLQMLARNFNSVLRTDKPPVFLQDVGRTIQIFLLQSPGFMRRILLPYLEFYVPNFYPERRERNPFINQILNRLMTTAR